MGASPDFRDFVLEMLEPFGRVTARAMFGGVGLFRDSLMFGLISSEDVLYLRVDDGNRKEFEARGLGPFTPSPACVMPYYETPSDALEDAELLSAWAARAWEAARRSGTRAKKRRKRR